MMRGIGNMLFLNLLLNIEWVNSTRKHDRVVLDQLSNEKWVNSQTLDGKMHDGG